MATAPVLTGQQIDDYFSGLATQREQQLKQSMAAALPMDPNTMGEAQRLSARTGVGADIASRNLPMVRKQAALLDLQDRELASTSPILAQQLSNPNFAAIAHDQIDNLSQAGELFQKVKSGLRSTGDVLSEMQWSGRNPVSILADHSDTVREIRGEYDQGHAQFERGMLEIKNKRKLATPDDLKRISDLDAQMRAHTDPETTGGKLFGGLASMAGSMLPMVPRIAAVGGAGAAVGAGAGALIGGVGAIPGAITGFKLGAESEFAAQTYEVMAGNAYGDLLERGVPEDRAQWTAGTVGAVNTALQMGVGRIVAPPMAGAAGNAVSRMLGDTAAGKLFNRALGDTVADAMTKPATAAAVKSALLQWGKNTAVGSGEMLLQSIVSKAGQDFAEQHGYTGTDPETGEGHLFSAEFGKQLGHTLVDAALTMGSVNAATGMIGFAGARARVAHASQSAAFFDGLSQNAAESKVRERNPDAYESFIAAQAKGTGADTIYVDGRQMATLLNQSGLDPEKVESAFPGLRQDVAEAAATGGDVSMPTSQYAAKLVGTPLGDAMKPHMRLDPDAMSWTESLQFQQKQAELQQQAQQEATQQVAGDQDTAKSARVVERNIFDQLKATRTMTDDHARANASMVRDFVATQAVRQGMTPEEFFDKYRYTVQRAGMERTEAPPTLLHQAVEGIRSVVQAAREPGHAPAKATIAPVHPWIVESAKAHGLDLDGYQHVIDGSAVRHALNRHGDEATEIARGQLPIRDADFEQIPSIIDNPDRVVMGTKTRGGKDQIGYLKKLEDGTTLYLEEVRTGKKELATVSMRKYPAAKDFDAIAGTLPSNARGDGGTATMLTPPEDRSNLLKQSVFRERGIAGHATGLLLPTGKMAAAYHLMEAADLTPSHDPKTFAKTPAYPEGVQERAYDTSKEAQARVVDQAQNYEPAYTVNTNPDAVNGPPVVTRDGVVLGGNSRAMSTMRLYSDGRSEVYRDALKRNAPAFGFTPEQVEGMQEPVLVRRVDAPTDRDGLRRLGTDLNRSMTGALGAAEKAVSAGKNLRTETLRSVSEMLQEGDYTLRELMAAQGPKLVQMLGADGVITDRERPQYIEAGGGLNEAGKAFVERALLGSVIDDPRLMESTPKSVLNKVERSLGAITSFSSRADEWNVLPVIREAVSELGAVQRAGSTVELWTGQTGMFGGERNPVVDAMMHALDGKPNAVREAFDTYSRDADANLPGQARMFGEASAVNAFNHAFGSTLTEQEFADGLERAHREEHAGVPASADEPAERDPAGQPAAGEPVAAAPQDSSADVPESATGSERPGSAEPAAVRAAERRTAAVASLGTARGGFDPATFTTLLGEKADASTFLHETAHYFLTVFSDLAREDGGDPATREDFDKLLNWFGVKDRAAWDAMSLDEQRQHHEQFAYSFEKYLSEGKAPSLEAQGVFDRFTQWLKRVYKSVRDDLNTIYRQQHGKDLPILTGDVRDVMDRMLASDDQIRQAQAVRNMEPVFKSAEVSGMNEAEWKAYGELARSATESASAELAGKSVREMQWLSGAKSRLLAGMQAQHAELREGVRAEAKEALLRSEPVYRAHEFLRTGDLYPEGKGEVSHVEEHRIDTEAARKLLPEGKTIQDLPFMTKKGGLDPDVAAAAAGFPDGKAMVEAIVNAKPLKDAVDAATDQRMAEQHGELATPNGMAAAVEKAVHNEARARLIAFEMRHAFNMNESERVLVKAARETARRIIDREKFADINPTAYAAREARAARQAQAAAARGDAEGVGRAKRDQLLQNALTSEALRVKDEAQTHLRYLNKFDSPSTSVTKAIGAEHMDAINELLAGYGLSSRERYSDRSVSMAQWIGDEYSRTGVMPAVPDDLVDRLGTMRWKDMTVVQLRDLRDAVKSLEYTGRRQMEVFLDGKAKTVDDLVQAVQDNLADLKHTPVEDIRARMKHARGLDKLGAVGLATKFAIRSADAGMLKMEQYFQFADAGKYAGLREAPIDGPMQSVYRRAAAASARERDMRAESKAALHALGESLRGSKVDLNERLEIPELPREGHTRWYRSELLSVVLNMGNESNKTKLLLGYGWSESAAVSAIDRLLSPAEMHFIQGVWDHLNSYGDEIRQLQRRQTGVSPQMIEATPLETKHGAFKGGYYPVVYNDVLDSLQAEKQARNADALFENNFARPATASGHTIARTNYVGPLYLDLSVIARHIDQVTHDLAWREAIVEMNKVLMDKRLQDELNQVYGREYQKQFRPWLQAMANDRVFNTAGDSAWENAVRKVRSNATMVGIGFRFSTMAIHGTSALSNSLGELGPVWFSKGVNQFTGVDRFQEARQFVFDRSPEMAHRMDEADRNVHEAISEINAREASVTGTTAARKLFDGARKFAFRGVGILDMASALPTWMGAYLKGMAHAENGGLGLGEEAAIQYADRAVRNAHGGGGTQDLSAIQRDKGVMSLATMFYSYWNHVYNRQRDLGKGYAATFRGLQAGDTSVVRDFPKLLARSWFYLVIPAIAHTLWHAKKQDGDGLSGYLEEIAEGIGGSFLSGIPLVRDIAKPGIEAAVDILHGKQPHVDYSITPLQRAGETFFHTIEDAAHIVHGDKPKRAVQDAAESIGYATGLPTAQPAATAKFLWNVVDGDVHPKDVGDWWRGVLTGNIK